MKLSSVQSASSTASCPRSVSLTDLDNQYADQSPYMRKVEESEGRFITLSTRGYSASTFLVFIPLMRRYSAFASFKSFIYSEDVCILAQAAEAAIYPASTSLCQCAPTITLLSPYS